MDKGSKNRVIDRVRTLAVYAVAKEFGVTTSFVYSVLNGTFKSGKADDVKKAYKTAYNKIQEAANKN